MLMKEISAVFEEFATGMASVSDLELLLHRLITEEANPEFEGALAFIVDELKPLESRPMLVGSVARHILRGQSDGATPPTYNGLPQSEVTLMIPVAITGILSMTDLQLGFIQQATDYVAP